MNRPRKITMISRTITNMLLVTVGVTWCGTAAQAQLVTPLPNSTGLRFEAQVDAPVWLLTVSGPREFYLRRTFRGTVPILDLSSYLEATPVDGIYVWELRASWPATETGSKPKIPLRQQVQSGTFTIVDGMLAPVIGFADEHPSTLDQKVAIVHNDDVLVQGRMCIGDDCTGAESMPFEVIKLKQNNNWIRFDDTSGTGFPANDWQIRANDSSDGGASYFAIEDISGTTVPVKVEAGATTDSIRVDQNGRVGLGTATPSARLHVVGNTFLDGDLTVTSSRMAKTDFDAVDVDRVLEKLGNLPLKQWTYRADDSEARHLGPFAEDFHSTFGLGRNETSVNPLDLAGVAMAAAQGLQARVEKLRGLTARQQAEIDSLRRDRDALLERLEALEARIAAPLEEAKKGTIKDAPQ